MNTKLFPVLLILLTLTLKPLFASEGPEVSFTTGTYDEVLAKAKENNKVLMIDFVTDWCKWCVETDKKVYTNPEVADFANTNQVNWKVDAEKGEGVELAKKYNVKGYPTIVFVNGEGAEIDRIYGYIFAEDFLTHMKDYSAGINTYSSLKKAVEENPNDPAANYKYADKLMNIGGDQKEAEEHLNKTVAADPNNAAGYTDDAKYGLAALKNDPEAIRSFMKEYPASDKMKDAYISLAGSMMEKDYKGAYGIYKEAFDKYGANDQTVTFNYGMFLLDRGYGIMADSASTDELRKEGLTALDEALNYTKGSVNEPTTYYVIASLNYQMHEITKANEAIDKALALSDKKSYRDLKDKINKTQTEKR